MKTFKDKGGVQIFFYHTDDNMQIAKAPVYQGEKKPHTEELTLRAISMNTPNFKD